MSHADGAGDEVLAGDFSTWVAEMRAALRGERPADVACGSCTACCTSFQFIQIAPDEADALAHIPADLLVPAPGLPAGHVVLGYDERGHCPLLLDGRCSVYEHRPRACRTYDCRVFAAAGVEADQAGVAQRARQWRFTYAGPGDRARHEAMRAFAQEYQPTDAPAIEKAVRAVDGVDR
jgi:Fe-S-cluster containining protein